MTTPFITVLLDPHSGHTHSVPALVDTPADALALVKEHHPTYEVRGIFDLLTLQGWLDQLDALPGDELPFLAMVVRPDEQSVPVLLRSTDMAHAASRARTRHPNSRINGVFSRAVLGQFVEDVQRLIAQNAESPATASGA